MKPDIAQAALNLLRCDFPPDDLGDNGMIDHLPMEVKEAHSGRRRSSLLFGFRSSFFHHAVTNGPEVTDAVLTNVPLSQVANPDPHGKGMWSWGPKGGVVQRAGQRV